jgi:L-threonylcarbamoyladenylate synthase
MRVLSKDEVREEQLKIKDDILAGAVFIHPTDTIYGLGCDATNPDAVQKIRDIKERFERPFSVIAPSKEWIMENCEMTGDADEWLEKLPGPYTLIMKLKNKDAVAEQTNMGMDTIGVRMPDHWFLGLVKMLNVPVITTSANRIDEEFMTSMDNLDITIKSKLDFAIYEGEKQGRPSKIVRLDKEDVEIKSR